MTTTDEWEYRTVEGPRKGPEPYSLEDEGWERDYSQGRPGEAWDRFDHHEEYNCPHARHAIRCRHTAMI